MRCAKGVILDRFEPEIIAFCCEYCGYAAADLAGSMRLSYPANLKIVKIPCTGRFDIIHALKAFEAGADGIFVFGCLEGNCHFEVGNLRAKKRVEHLRRILDECGIGGERVGMYNMSSAMGRQFAEAAREVTEKIRGLGPNPVKAAKSRERRAEG
ncbi:MAG: Methyl-viologen-reducing hydrogenase, delta subunit [Syntrophorhabdus sp. PtaU1.Bin058]|nr:MAG: Methyl-viologen-reducing hydrogenase, delta subunit [Syntrophorhabdus sp. PtaU1.Bin058]